MNKVLMGEQYVANFLDQPVQIGSIIRMDDKQSLLVAHYTDFGRAQDLAKYTSVGSKGALRFSEEKNVTAKFGASATTSLGASEVSLKFRRARSIAGALSDVYVEALRFGPLLDNIKKIWVDGAYDKYRRQYFLIFQVMAAASGTLIYSEDKGNEVVLKHTLGEKVTKIVDLGSGNFEYVSNTKRTLELIRTSAHRPLFKALRFRSNWQPEVLG